MLEKERSGGKKKTEIKKCHIEKTIATDTEGEENGRQRKEAKRERKKNWWRRETGLKRKGRRGRRKGKASEEC